MQPIFSILIPSYNRPSYIKKTIDSVLLSSYPNFELIISDDNSPASTEISKVINSFNDKRIKFFNQSSNLGEALNRQFLIDKSISEWKIILCDDDLLQKDALLILSKQIDLKKDVDLFLFGYKLIDQNDKNLSKHKALFGLNIHYHNSSLIKEILKFDIFPYKFFSPVTFCFNTNISNNVRSSLDVGMADDLTYLVDIFLGNYKSYIIPKYMMSYRKLQNGHKGLDNQINISLSFKDQVIGKSLMYDYIIKKYGNDIIYSEYLNSFKYKFDFLLICYTNKSIATYFKKNLNLFSHKELKKIRSYKKYYFINFYITKISRLFNLIKVYIG